MVWPALFLGGDDHFFGCFAGVLGSLRAAAALLARVASASGDVLPTLLLAAKDDLGMALVRPCDPKSGS